ncbi:MAG: hypothetical protein WKF88_11930 [Ferruginibacter sp.]
MRKLKIYFITLIGILCISPVFAQLSADQKVQRIKASYAIVSGREPAAGEVEHWKKQADLTVQQLVGYHTQYASKEPSFKRDLITGPTGMHSEDHLQKERSLIGPKAAIPMTA